ncbi:hypothetical protein L226DRAFT_48437 [Lentinus tigrinus ALCF2SS1-7]|uniref:uncharacterized protein n=1 Tax=Lentinus tigrinus ALCF2SS1-7 TaxID=1328758 RepID=UPI0011661A56|nr:hypothetical protein L226DRAFT_48437 [Lentinus tigrinus ALCF2SS1-7]
MDPIVLRPALTSSDRMTAQIPLLDPTEAISRERSRAAARLSLTSTSTSVAFCSSTIGNPSQSHWLSISPVRRPSAIQRTVGLSHRPQTPASTSDNPLAILDPSMCGRWPFHHLKHFCAMTYLSAPSRPPSSCETSQVRGIHDQCCILPCTRPHRLPNNKS